MTPKEALISVVEYAGGQKAVADAIGHTQASISQMLKAGQATPKAAALIAQKFPKAATLHSLRPDLFPAPSDAGSNSFYQGGA